jgi:hypothetical protein
VNTGQVLLTTGAIVLIGTTVLTVNRMYSNHGIILQKTKIGIYAVSLATSLIEEASGKAYDEVTVDDAVSSTSSLSSTLGPESGETTTPPSTARFDDFDDYNGLNMGINIAGVDSFMIRATVFYVTDSAPDVQSSSKQWQKKLTVAVTSVSMSDTTYGRPDTVKMSYVFSYFYFR